MRKELEKKIEKHFTKFFNTPWTMEDILAVATGNVRKVSGFFPAYAHEGGIR